MSDRDLWLPESLDEILHAGLSQAVEMLDPTPHPYLHDPIGWMEARLGEKTWGKPAAFARSIVENRYTAAPAGHELGKSHIMSRLAAWWIDVHPPGEALVITTAPTFHQVSTILWEELKQVHTRAELPGTITEDARWKIPIGDKMRVVGMGRKPADNNPTGFSGQHRRFVLVLVDESIGVPKAFFEALDSTVGNIHSRFGACGNPDDPSAYFEEICRPGSGWNVIPMSCLESPNFTEEALEPYPDVIELMMQLGIEPSREPIHEHVRDLLVSPLWVHERIQRWGINSPTFIAKVLGQFPDISDDTLITPKAIREAQARELPGMDRGQFAFDIAGLGPDETCGYRNRGGQFRLCLTRHRQAEPDTEDDIERILGPFNGGVGGWIDCDGIGGGVQRHLVRRGVKVWSHRGSETARDPKRFANRRAEVAWNLRDLFNMVDTDTGADIDPLDDKLAAQCGSIKFFTNSKGKIQVESKDDMKKRGLPSPDRFDGVTMANIEPPRAYQTPPENTGLPSGLTSGMRTAKW